MTRDAHPEIDALLRLFEKAKAGACTVCGQYGHGAHTHREPVETLARFQWKTSTTPEDYTLWLLDTARDLGIETGDLWKRWLYGIDSEPVNRLAAEIDLEVKERLFLHGEMYWRKGGWRWWRRDGPEDLIVGRKR